MNTDGISTGTYFATKAPDVLCRDIIQWIDDFYDYLLVTGKLGVWQRSYEYYYRGSFKGARLNLGGEQDEYKIAYVNHFRNLIQHILIMTTSQRPSFDPRSANTDYESQAQTIVATGVLDYYNREKNIDTILKRGTEHSLLFDAGYILMIWDALLGDIDKQLSMANNKITKQGDVFLKNYSPIDVIFDYTAGFNNAKQDWYILRDYKNKFELAQQYPAQAQQILTFTDETKFLRKFRTGIFAKKDSDYIPVYKFFHDKTAAVPNGRIFECLGDNCWLNDGPLPYRGMPLYRIAASEQDDTGFGYTVAYDLLPLQESIDGLYSVVITNQSNFGVQNILMPAGSNIGTKELIDGLNLLTYDPKLGKPESLNLTNTPKEIFEFIQMLERVMETLAGINSVARGNPEASLKSGSALALVQSMAIQFNSGLQQSYAHLLEDIGTGLIHILQDYAQTPRMAEITGKSNQSYLKEFTGQDIDSISRVTVDMGNPLSRTTAGKVNLADNLLNAGMIEDPKQYIQVLTTGKLEPVIEGKQSELMLIRSENEQLAEGQQVPVIAIDNHPLHIIEHKTVISSPQARMNLQVIQNTLNHINQHLQEWMTTNPLLLQLTGQQPPPPPMPMPGATGGNGETMNAENPVTQKADKVKPAGMPTNPLTHEKFNNVTGGLK